MYIPKAPFRLAAASAALVLLISGCTVPAGGSGSGSSSSRPASPYYVNVRVESFSRGGAAKVNGTIAGALPATVQLETDAAGLVTRSYTIQLSTNILQPTVTPTSGDELVDASRVF